MRPVYLASALLGVGAIAGVGISWATFEHDIVVRQRAAVEWIGLTQADQSLREGHRPYNSDVAIFLSNRAVEKALKQLAGATITPPSDKYGDLKITIKDVALRPTVGLAGVALTLEISSMQRGITLIVAADANLAFRGVRTGVVAGGHSLATADFALSILSAEPRLKWGFLDISGRQFVSELISSGLMLALDKDLVVSVPFEDRLALDTKIDAKNVLPTDAGSVTLAVTMPGKVLEQRFAITSPLFLKSGVWLLANVAADGQSALPAPAAPNLAAADLSAKVASLRAAIAQATQGLEQPRDLVLWVKGSGLVGLLDKLESMPRENRTVTLQSEATTGQLTSDGKSYAELSNPRAATALIVVAPLNAQWTANRGVSFTLDVSADLAASIHAHVNPLPVGGGAGTTVGMVGGATKRVAGTLTLANSMVAGHSVLLLGLEMPCDNIDTELRTDGKLIVGPMKTDVISVGLRWSIPVPRSVGQSNVVLDDTPRRFPTQRSDWKSGGMRVVPAHPAVEFTMHITNATANTDGYIIMGDLDLRPVDKVEPTSDEVAQRAAIAKALADANQAASTACTTEQHMRVLLGGMEIGPNGVVWQTIYNAINDLTHGPGPNNEVVKAGNNAVHDLTHGPGPNNEVVKAGNNAVHDLTHGPGPNNEVVKALRSINPF
jgi:hypothetical protein